MNRFKNILVAASPGHLQPMTLRASVKLAEANGARLTVIDVMAPLLHLRRQTTVRGRIVEVEAELLRHRKEQVRHLVDDVEGTQDTEIQVLVGEPFIEVIRYVIAHGIDLVIVGGEEVRRWELPTFGSDVMHLLRKCPVPLWVMRPPITQKLRVLALVDPDPEDPIRDSLNDLVVTLAASLALLENGELHVGHAWGLAGEATLRSSPYVRMPGEIVDVMVEAEEAWHREQLDLLMGKHGLTERQAWVHLVPGEAGQVLPRLAEGLEVSVIVMGTVARTGLSGLIMGNTADTILRSVRCSVLAVKPEGFITPVKPRRPTKAR